MTAEISLVDTLKANLRQGGIFIAFIAIVVLFWAFNPDTFLSSGNLTNIVLQYSYILILAIGMLFVIVLAQIDLSVGSVVAVTGALSGVLVIKQGYPWWVGVVAALVMGILIGAFQGFWVAYVGIPGFIVTLAGMLRPRAGELTLDGAAPWGAARGEVAERVSLTAEDAHVFATTVLENLRAANPALEPEGALRLLRAVGLGDWVAALPDGVDTRIGSGATTVSGGERRRLLMARALASPAPLMLVDEASEHLDPATADALVGTLFDQGAGRGTLLVTHRLAGAARADSVLVLGPGPGPAARVVDNAPYSEIIARRPDLAWAAGQEEA